jgi:Xaa-Pro aminopeptidase
MPRAVFDSNEYDRRITRTKERLREEGVDAAFVSDPANMNYLTGYDGWSFYVHQGVVLTQDRDEPVWVGRDMDANGARATTTLSEESIRPYSDDYVQSPHDLHSMDFAAHEGRVLHGQGLSYAVANRGADHMYALFYSQEYPLVEKDDAYPPDGFDGRPKRLIEKENQMAVNDSGVVCKVLIGEWPSGHKITLVFL